MKMHGLQAAAAICVAILGCKVTNDTPDGGSPSGEVGSFMLTVLLTGSGTVTSTPAGIHCGPTCTATFINGTQVQLTAAALPGWTFAGFSGACTGTSCTVTMSSDLSVGATFTQNPPPPPAGKHSLAVALLGQGTVSSTPAGIACGPTCSATFDDGAQVQLSATPASNWTFTGFSGACSGTTCNLTLSADLTVIATFAEVPPPPPPVVRTLTVAVQGQGTVTSTPAGIACAPTCTASFNGGTQVQLAPAPATNWTFAGFSGACTGATCTVAMAGDVMVIATFTEIPPPDVCAGLVPSTLPAPVVATLRDHDAIGGTSDELGNYLLGFIFDGADTFDAYQFFTLQGGQAVRIGDEVHGADNSALSVYSQPSGFTTLNTIGMTGRSQFTSYDHGGILQDQRLLVPESLAAPPSTAIGIDPSGGTAVARHYRNGALPTDWVTTYQRLDKTGAPETAEVVLDNVADHRAAAVGVALSGSALVIASNGVNHWQARWVAKTGQTLTDWFLFNGTGAPVAQFLMDGSVAIGFRGTGAETHDDVAYLYKIRDGSTALDALPDWLAQRSGNRFYVIRNGLAYLSWGSSGQCPAGSVEVVAVAGKSCGCVHVPFLGKLTSVGRDGSLIVPRPTVQPPDPCRYDLYPQLLK